MKNPTDSVTAWQKAAFDATFAYAQAAIASAEQLLKLNLDAAKTAFDQNAQTARDLMAVTEPQQIEAIRAKLAQISMQRSASYAQNIYEIVSQAQAHLSKVAEEQFGSMNAEMMKTAETAATGIPGSEAALAAVKSTVAASSAMLDTLNRAAKQFQELSEASIKSATSNMVRGAGKK